MPMIGICEPCREKGHICETRNMEDGGRYVCVFCADGVPCPIDERATERFCAGGCGARLRSNNKAGRCGKSECSRPTSGKFQEPAPAAPAKPAANPNSPWRKHGSLGLNKNTPAPTPLERETTTMRNSNRTCSCGCGTPLHGRWPYIKGHGGKSAEASPAQKPAPAAKKAARKYLKRTGGKPAPPANSSPNGLLTISVSEEHVDRLFLALSPQRKAFLVSQHLATEGL